MRKRPVRRVWGPLNKNRTSLKKEMIHFIVGIVTLFFITAIMTTLGPGASMSSASVNTASKYVTNELFVYMLGMENVYFTQGLAEDVEPPSISSTVFQLATSIDTEDPRSLLGSELPGFALFDGKILTAGEGADYTQMPIESAPPMEVLMAEREASIERLEEMDRMRQEIQNKEDLENVVHIIHTHNRESYFPELRNVDESDAHQASHGSVNITLAGERLSLELAKRGIGSVLDQSDISALLNERDWKYSQSYKVSREIINENINKNGEFDFYFDLHRDGQPREVTSVDINGETHARIFFVIGMNNPNYEKNQGLANIFHERIEEKYPGLSRGVYDPIGSGVNGVYNQDISPNSALIEFGGYGNSLEEVYRTVEAFADIFSEYYWELNGGVTES